MSILRSLPIEVPADFTFVDLGCGKGLTLLLATDHGFRRVIGVEFDPRLVNVARDNVRAYVANSPQHARVIDVVHQDAADYDFPAGPIVAFMFNPFGVSTLEVLVKNMARSLEESPRQFFVAYFNAVHRDVLDENPMLRRAAHTTRWVLYEAVKHR